jgi:hypothetical protein
MENLVKNLEKVVTSSLEQFVDRLVLKYDLNKNEVLNMWKNYSTELIPTKVVDSKDGCPYKFIKGAKSGTTCGAKSKDGIYCTLHKEKGNKPVKDKKVLPEPIKSSLKTSEKDVVLRKHEETGNLVHLETNMLFSPERRVVGKLENNKKIKLTDEDMEVCKKWRFMVQGPTEELKEELKEEKKSKVKKEKEPKVKESKVKKEKEPKVKKEKEPKVKKEEPKGEEEVSDEEVIVSEKLLPEALGLNGEDD